ncbi:hypothetical protein AB0L40_21240 [Patulibacter sp. NPDC049589]|uniref:hypothetical protein n=1 Tax=Patulibacter sp. NPDC049589 TaxID=3154731 RepID=UPI00341F77EE
MLGVVGVVVCGAVRDRGRAIQPTLWRSWGGAPTIRRLRWRDAGGTDAVARLHERLGRVLVDPLPTRDEEQADPAGADRRYDEAVAELRERTREGFPLVLAENAEYGFRRNTLGLRPIALGLCVAVIATSLLLELTTGEVRFVASAAWALANGCAWYLRVSDRWVRKAADLYADRLLDASRRLS